MSDNFRRDVSFVEGVLYVSAPYTPWCDCQPAKQGYRQREDGCWVKPCCDRRERYMWERYGDDPAIDPHRSLKQLRALLKDLEAAAKVWSSPGTRKRVAEVRAEIQRRRS